MHFFKERLERYKGLIEAGDIEKVINKMKNYDREVLQMNSNLGHLFERVKNFDINMKFAIRDLEEGKIQEALDILNGLKKKELKSIHEWAQLVAKEELKLE